MATINLATLLVKLEADSSKYQRELDKAKSKGSEFSGLAKTAIGGAVVGAFALATKAAADFARDSVVEFQQFQKGIKEVYTLMPGISAEAMGQMEADVLKFSREVGRTSDEVVPALYQAISAGIPAENAFEFLQTASDAALGGVTDLETAVDGITSVVNAYGSEVLGAAQASDVMFTAVRLGKTNFEELSNSLFNVIPTAASLGVSFADIASQLAVLTAQGVPTSVATTQIRAALVEASKGGTKLSDAIKQLTGQSFAELIASGMTASEIFDVLRQSMPEQQFKDLFGSVEALNAVLGVTGPNASKTASAYDDMQASIGATAEASKTMADSLEHSEALAKAATEELKILIGEGLSPAKKAWFDLVTTIATAASEHIHTRTAIDEVDDSAQDLADTLLEMADGQHNVLDAVQQINLQYGAFSGNMEDAEMRTAVLNTAIALLNEGFEGTGHELAATAIRLAETGDLTRQYTQDIIDAAIAEREGAEVTQSAREAKEAAAKAIREYHQEVSAARGPNQEWADKIAQTTNHLTEEEAAIRAANAANQAYFDGLAETARAQDEAALAAREHSAALAPFFVTALEAEAGAGLFNEALADLGTQYVTVGGRTAEQNAELERLQGVYNKAANTIRDYEQGLKGVGLEEDALNKKIEEQRTIMANAEAAMQPFLGITGSLTEKNVQATINQDAVNQAIFDSAVAADAGAAELAILGGALGLYSAEATEAALQSALIQEKINQLAKAYVDGGISVADMRSELNQFIADVGETAEATLNAAQAQEEASTAAGRLNQELDKVSGAAIDAAGNLNAIPRVIDVHVSVTSDPLPDFAGPGGPTGTGQAGQAFQHGGFTGGQEGMLAGVVHGEEFVFSAPAVRSIGLPELEALHRSAQGGGSARLGGQVLVQETNNFYSNTRESQALAQATVAERKRRRLDDYMGVR